MTLMKHVDGVDVEMTPEEEAEFLATAGGPAISPPRRFSKRQLFGAMTDEEFDTFSTIETMQSARMQRVFREATELSEDDPDFGAFQALLVGAYGETRAAELLDAADLSPPEPVPAP